MRLRNVACLRFLYAMAFLIFWFGPVEGRAQEQGAQNSSSEAPSLSDSVHQMQVQIQQLQSVVQKLKEEAGHYRTETLQLKQELALTREKLDAMDRSAKAPSGESQSTKLEDDLQLLNSKVDVQYQTKVDSDSKYRVRLSGILLMNVFSNKGYTDHLEIPGVALPATPSLTGGNTGGSFGATVRQSQLGLEVYGPTVAGAKTRGDFVADFFGEFPETVNGSSSGSLRVRTSTIRLDWQRTSLVAGIDDLFFSPTYPTSFASLGIPAFSYAGNL